MAVPVMPALGRLRQLETSRGSIVRPFLNKQADVPCPPPLDSRAGFSQLAFSGSSFTTGQECPGFQMYANLDSVR